MNRDDPFAEPFDTEKTVIRPNPAGRRPAAPTPMPPPEGAQQAYDQPHAQPQSQAYGQPAPKGMPVAGGLAPAYQAGASARPAVPLSNASAGMNPLNAAASPLFALVARIRNRAQHADPAALRESVIAEVRAFGNNALAAGVPADMVRMARYAICATVDDVVLNTPWGGQSIWTQQSIVGTFHKETYGGDRFYDLLTRLESAPSQNLDLLEFFYVCLSLGFEGRLRVAQRGAEKHLSIRDGLARLIRTHRGSAEPALAPHWKGSGIRHKLLSVWTPLFIASGVALAAICLMFFVFSFLLSGDTRQLSIQIAALDFNGPIELARPAPPPPPLPPAPKEVETIETVSAFLEPEIKEGLVSVRSQGNTLTINIAGEGMFASASDLLDPRFQEIMDRVAKALDDEPGRIIVAGHSDNVPIRTARFPSNLQLSLARAQSVMARISASLKDNGRISAEGRADKEPVASNDTPEGRAKNRRIEVILVKAG
ncbi:type VI secretion system protein TssL, long form [Roseibium litorale]|uniref:Type VI secretion system protein TssL n=1 Tax=Roseibium litorale TaxID=2803841 RepID=A0ABR9CKN0_9HYPH|nr:type VI secretion system protein TssL, long form [Roseibium litorale]MBD8891283.1 type VI secretion system protein TssL [Roseibium litorale]